MDHFSKKKLGIYFTMIMVLSETVKDWEYILQGLWTANKGHGPLSLGQPCSLFLPTGVQFLQQEETGVPGGNLRPMVGN